MCSGLTLQTVSVEQFSTFIVALHAALLALDTLARDAPQQALALEAVRGRGGGEHLERMRSRARNRVDDRLQCLLVDV